MTRELPGLLAANALVLVAGAGATTLLGATTTRRELAARVGLAYLVGLAVVGIAAATLALVRIGPGVPLLLVLAAAGAVPALRALRTPGRGAAPRSRADRAATVAGVAFLAALLARAAPAFAAAPLERHDAWALWALKGRALHELGGADPAVFAGDAYAGLNLAYPLLLPALLATGFDATGGFDPQAPTVQFLLFGVGLLGAFGALLHERVPPWLLWPSLGAVAAAPAVSSELVTGYADVPLAAFVAAGALAAARWLRWEEPWALRVAALLLAAALLTKHEAPLFAGGILVGLVVARLLERRPLRPIAPAALAAVLPLLLWRVYVSAHDLTTGHDTGDGALLGVVPIALARLAGELVTPARWGLLVPLAAAAVVLAGIAGARGLGLFALSATTLPLAGLTANYATSGLPHDLYLSATVSRVVASIVLVGALLTPLLAAEAVRPRPSPAPSSARAARRGGSGR